MYLDLGTRWSLVDPWEDGLYGRFARVRDGAGLLGVVWKLDSASGWELLHPALPVTRGRGTAPFPWVILDLPAGGPGPDTLQGWQVRAIVGAVASLHLQGLVHGGIGHSSLAWVGDDPVLVGLGQRSRGTPSAGADDRSLGAMLRERVADPRVTEILGDLAEGRITSGAALEAMGTAEVAPQGARPALLLRRASALPARVDAGTEEALQRWADTGGILGIVGQARSGGFAILSRGAMLAHLAGEHVVSIPGGQAPWWGIRYALQASDLPGPPVDLPGGPTVGDRALLAARALADRTHRRLHVLVDDWEAIDPGTAATLEALARSGVADLLVVASAPPAWLTDTLQAPPLDLEARRRLVEGMLGGPVEGPLGDVHHPGALVDAVVAVAATRDVHWSGSGWSWTHPLALAEVHVAHLEPADVQVLAAVSVLEGGAPVADVVAGVGMALPEVRAALARLAGQGFVHAVNGGIAVTGTRVGELARAAADALPLVHRGLADRLVGVGDLERASIHLVGAGERGRLLARGPAALEALARSHPPSAIRLARKAWQLLPMPALGASLVHALHAAGHTQEARSQAEAMLIGRAPAREHLEILVLLAAILEEADPDRVIAQVREARSVLAAGERPPLRLVAVEVRALRRAGDLEAALRLASRAAREYPPVEVPEADAWLAIREAWAEVLYAQGRGEDGLRVLSDVPSGVGRGRASRVRLEVARGRLLVALGHRAEGVALLLRVAEGDTPLSFGERTTLMREVARVQLREGRRTESASTLRRAMDRLEAHGDRRALVDLALDLALRYSELLRLDEAAALVERVSAECAGGSLPARQRRVSVVAARVALSRGDVAAAERHLHRAAALGDERASLGVAEVRALAGADDALATAEVARRTLRGHRLEARARALVALALARGGRRDRALALLGEREDALRDAGLAEELALVRLWKARAYLALGKISEARELARHAALFGAEVEHLLLRDLAQEVVSRADTAAAPSAADARLGQVLDLAVRISRERDLEPLLDGIAAAALELCDADRAFVLLLDEADGEPRIEAARYQPGREGGTPSTSVVKRVVESGQAVVADDLTERGDLRGAKSVISLRLEAVMCVPMVDGEGTTGALYVDSLRSSGEDLTALVPLLRALGAYAAIAVTSARLFGDQARAARRAADFLHDIRSPLGVALATAEEVLTHGEPQDWVVEALSDVQRASSQALDLAEGLVGTESTQEVDLSALTRVQGALLERRARVMGRSIHLDVADGVGVVGRARDLARVLDNLVANALRHGPEGEPVAVGLCFVDGVARWSVRDQGGGLSEEVLAHLFHRGFTRGEGGRGLGLDIVRRLVAEHGGQVSADNHPDGGAMFLVELPLSARSGSR